MREITVSLNGRDYQLVVRDSQTLLEVIREEVGLKGTVEGCSVGVCGSCTVLIDDLPVSSCLMLAANVDDRRITTIEGMSAGDSLSPVQQAFLDEQAFQCGFCTPGMIMATEGLLRERAHPNEEEIRDYLSGNLCRCGTYTAVISAVKRAATSGTERSTLG
jgi:aerobic-type carbon monoxide dehydrogenase small subunit (CoxS/CutS family)